MISLAHLNPNRFRDLVDIFRKMKEKKCVGALENFLTDDSTCKAFTHTSLKNTFRNAWFDSANKVSNFLENVSKFIKHKNISSVSVTQMNEFMKDYIDSVNEESRSIETRISTRKDNTSQRSSESKRKKSITISTPSSTQATPSNKKVHPLKKQNKIFQQRNQQLLIKHLQKYPNKVELQQYRTQNQIVHQKDQHQYTLLHLP